MTKAMVRGRPRNPEALHQLVRRHGVQACTDLIAAATPAQVTAVLDLDLWRPANPGEDVQFDADRFGDWLEALVDADPAVAARIVAGLDVSLVVTGLARLMRVFDVAAGAGLAPPGCSEGEVGGYLLRGHDADRWDAIVLLAAELETSYASCFHAVMQGVRTLSNSAPEIDGLDELLDRPAQELHDLALARDERRAQQGYVTPGDARAFLALARRDGLAATSRCIPNPVAAAYAREAGGAGPEVQLAFLINVLVAGCSIRTRPFTPEEAADAVAATCRLGRERPIAAPVVAAASVIDVRLTVRDAAAVRLELVDAFEVGWAVLHHEVAMFVTAQLIALLSELRIADTATDEALAAMRRELVRQHAASTPWRARDALDIVATLDTPGWIAILGLLDECPHVPEALVAIVERRTGAVSATAFAFVASGRDLDVVRAFLARVPGLLT